MPRKSRAANSIEPPRLPPALATDANPPMLADGVSYTKQALHDFQAAGETAEDVLFEQVACRQGRFGDTILMLPQLYDVRFDGCDFAGAAWNKAQVRRVELLGCRAVGLKLADGSLEDVRFHKCNATLARIWSCSCRGARFEACVLREASFTDSDLSGVVFANCDLTGADMRGAKLNGTDFRGSTISGMQLDVHKLKGAIMDATQAVHLAAMLGVTVQPIDEEGINA